MAYYFVVVVIIIIIIISIQVQIYRKSSFSGLPISHIPIWPLPNVLTPMSLFPFRLFPNVHGPISIEMRRKKPKEFWKIFKQKKFGQKSNLTENDFYEYFKNLSAEITDNSPEKVGDFLHNFDLHDRNSIFPELDEQISKEEILKAIKFFKINKSSGNDDILHEYFHKAAEILIEPLHILFNKILNSGSFPKQWATGLIVPIHKKGSYDDPNNYQGITLISCFAKHFTSVLNNRLKKWADDNDVSSDAQFGFKSDHSTIDAIFLLKYLIDNYRHEKNYIALL